MNAPFPPPTKPTLRGLLDIDECLYFVFSERFYISERRVRARGLQVVAGRVPSRGKTFVVFNDKSVSAVPSGLIFSRRRVPTLKRWAIFGCPCGTGQGTIGEKFML